MFHMKWPLLTTAWCAFRFQHGEQLHICKNQSRTADKRQSCGLDIERVDKDISMLQMLHNGFTLGWIIWPDTRNVKCDMRIGI